MKTKTNLHAAGVPWIELECGPGGFIRPQETQA